MWFGFSTTTTANVGQLGPVTKSMPAMMSAQFAAQSRSHFTTTLSLETVKKTLMRNAMFSAQIEYIGGTHSRFIRRIAIAKILFAELVGGNRVYRMQLLKKRTFKSWLEANARDYGWYRCWPFREPSIKRFLHQQGFKHVELSSDFTYFTCRMSLGWLPLPGKPKLFYLPRWAVIYSEVEKMWTKAGPITFAQALSLYDTMCAYDSQFQNGAADV